MFFFLFSKIEIPPDERVLDKVDNNNRRGGNQSSRNTGATNGQPLQKLCSRIQKETCIILPLFSIRLIVCVSFSSSDKYHIFL